MTKPTIFNRKDSVKPDKDATGKLTVLFLDKNLQKLDFFAIFLIFGLSMFRVGGTAANE